MRHGTRVWIDASASHPALRTELRPQGVAQAADRLYARECERGRTAYDPNQVEFYRLPPYRGIRFTLLFAPGRKRRPQAPSRCPVCWNAVGASGRLYAGLRIGARPYRLLVNPYPYMPSALTVAAAEHVPQDWAFPKNARRGADGDSSDGSAMLASDAVALASALEGRVIIWNGIGAGSSLPGHAHLQTFCLPAGHGPLAVQQVTERTRGRTGWHGLAGEYPLVFHFANGACDAVSRETASAMRAWNRVEGPAASGNLVAMSEAGTVKMWYFPRNRCYPRAPWLAGALGALEMSGAFVLSADWELRALRAGRIDMRTLYASLRAVGPERASIVAAGARAA